MNRAAATAAALCQNILPLGAIEFPVATCARRLRRLWEMLQRPGGQAAAGITAGRADRCTDPGRYSRAGAAHRADTAAADIGIAAARTAAVRTAAHNTDCRRSAGSTRSAGRIAAAAAERNPLQADPSAARAA